VPERNQSSQSKGCYL